MQENLPLTIERLSEEQEREFRIASKMQIRSLLRNLSEKGLLAALYYDGVKDFIMTTVLDVGEEGFWVEQGVDALRNHRIAASKRVALVSLLDQVKLQFFVDEIRAVTHQGYPAFYLPLPANLYRLQHREYYRLMLPHSEQLRCLVPVGKPANRIEVSVMDISVGGMRLFYTGNDIEFIPGQTYTDCLIDLPETGRISVAITVKNLVSITPKPGHLVRRVGCEFNDLDNATNILLQRYVTRMQRLRAAAA